ncbi:unnamed protein product [Lupinus luteus]|uniref:Bromo domain-containing protein n=1 Tax=Lupinus luteus TaxID=3873 RepID=A0AAV1XFY3_LUPLU
MDLRTIRSKIAAKDGSGYKNVRELYADLRLILNNDKKHKIHNMAKNLLKKFEKKLLELWPKLDKEEKRQLAEETQLHEVDMQLESPKALVIRKCRFSKTKRKSLE